MKEKIQTYVQLYLKSISLYICVEDNLKPKEGNLKNFGWFEVSDVSRHGETFHWDKLNFFNDMSYIQFKSECTEDILKAGLKVKPTFKIITKLIKRAKKLKLLNYENNN